MRRDCLPFKINKLCYFYECLGKNNLMLLCFSPFPLANVHPTVLGPQNYFLCKNPYLCLYQQNKNLKSENTTRQIFKTEPKADFYGQPTKFSLQKWMAPDKHRIGNRQLFRVSRLPISLVFRRSLPTRLLLNQVPRLNPLLLRKETFFLFYPRIFRVLVSRKFRFYENDTHMIQ